MAGLPLYHSKYFTYRKIVYQRFFVGLLLFILTFLVFSIILNIFSGSSHRIEEYEPVFLDINSADREVIEDSFERTSKRDSKCSYWNCFNVYRCGRGGHNRLTVYIYPLKKYLDEEGAPVSSFSKEFYHLLLAIKKSKYYTSNPEEACLLVPSIDVLNQHTFSSKHISKALSKLKYWNDGENHIIFNMLPGSAPNFNTVLDLDTGKAIIAGAGFDTWTFRHGFDISIPLYSEIAAKINNTQPKQKKFLLVSSQNNIPDDYLTILKNIALTSSDFLLLQKCGSEVCDYRTSKQYNYPEVLKDSIFCLVTRSARLAQTVLLDVIASQCIPIVVADSIVMPYSYQIDWSKFTLFVPEENLKSILSVVKSVSSERRTEMFWQLRWVFDKYFSSIERIVLTALDVLNEKVFPLSAKMYEEWNLPEHLYGPPNPLFLPVIAPKSPGFTAVILTYDRVDSLFTLIKRLVKTPSLVKIIVVWNNQLKLPPSQSEWPIINRPLKVIQTKANKLSNRFFPYDEIETECQLTIDDDIVMLTPDELEFGFDVWREFPDRIVGFPSRLHIWDNVTNSWKYHSEWTNQISMVLTGAAFHHKLWSWYYTYKMPNSILKWVDDNFNCEDIAMNFLVANITRKAPIKVTPRKKFKCPECTNTEMLSADATHMSQRSFCINYFAKIYGNLPLKTVEFRADPLQYLDVDGGIPLKYPNIGTL